MRRKAESYLGGHSIVRVDPVGRTEAHRKSAKGTGDSQSTEEFLKNYSVQQHSRKVEAIVAKQASYSNTDALLLGVMTSGWDVWLQKAKDNFEKIERANIRGEENIAHALNRFGFKTASGNIWNQRLVRVFVKRILSPQMRDNPAAVMNRKAKKLWRYSVNSIGDLQK